LLAYSPKQKNKHIVFVRFYFEKNEAPPLMIAAGNGHEECVRVLIAANADVTYADSEGKTALHGAAYHGCASICRVLVDEGASLTALNSDDQTPLEVAEGNAECVAILKEAVMRGVV